MVCVSSVSNAQVETSKTYSFNLSHLKNTNDASIIFWHWLLDYTKLTPQHASLHNIYQCDTSAFFFDLNNDGAKERIAVYSDELGKTIGEELLTLNLCYQ